jgi:hypothetical protein
MNTHFWRRSEKSASSFPFPEAAAVLCLMLVFSGCGGGDEAEVRRVEFKTGDGMAIQGTLHLPETRPAPAVICVQAAGATPDRWLPAARRFQRAGCVVLRFPLDEAVPDRETAGSYESAIAAAIQAVMARGGDAGNIAIIAEGESAPPAAAYALGDSRIQSLMLLSPALKSAGRDLEDLIFRLKRRPVLLMAGESDTWAVEAVTRLRRIAPGFCEVRLYPGSAAGADIPALSASAREQLVQWLEETLIRPGS